MMRKKPEDTGRLQKIEVLLENFVEAVRSVVLDPAASADDTQWRTSLQCTVEALERRLSELTLRVDDQGERLSLFQPREEAQALFNTAFNRLDQQETEKNIAELHAERTDQKIKELALAIDAAQSKTSNTPDQGWLTSTLQQVQDRMDIIEGMIKQLEFNVTQRSRKESSMLRKLWYNLGMNRHENE